MFFVKSNYYNVFPTPVYNILILIDILKMFLFLQILYFWSSFNHFIRSLALFVHY